MKIKTIIAILVGFSACEQTFKNDENENTIAPDNTTYFLKDTSVKILWHPENKDVPGDTGYAVMNEEYLKNISDPEKAALSFTTLDEGQEYDRYISKINSRFQLLTSLGQRSNNSDTSAEFLKQWFRYDPHCLQKIENGPVYSRTELSLDEISLSVTGDTIKVSLKVNASNLLMGQSWNYTKEDIFKFNGNSLQFIKENSSGKIL